MEAETLAKEQRKAYRRDHPSTASQSPPPPAPPNYVPVGDAAYGDATAPHPNSQGGSFSGKKRGNGRNYWSKGKGRGNWQKRVKNLLLK